MTLGAQPLCAVATGGLLAAMAALGWIDEVVDGAVASRE